MSDTWMYSSASGSKLLHSLGFPNDQWFFNLSVLKKATTYPQPLY